MQSPAFGSLWLRFGIFFIGVWKERDMFMPGNFTFSFLFCFCLIFIVSSNYRLWARKLLIFKYFSFASLPYLFDNAHFSDSCSFTVTQFLAMFSYFLVRVHVERPEP